jgi:hypothetical protein
MLNVGNDLRTARVLHAHDNFTIRGMKLSNLRCLQLENRVNHKASRIGYATK